MVLGPSFVILFSLPWFVLFWLAAGALALRSRRYRRDGKEKQADATLRTAKLVAKTTTLAFIVLCVLACSGGPRVYH